MRENNLIIDLPKLSMKDEIKHSEIILSILEICTFNEKYNYKCSNNTKAFWERVVDEEILKKIFKDYKAETLRKYWQIIRGAGNNNKYIEIVRKNQDFIDNPVFKLLPIINGIAIYIQNNEKNFEEFFAAFNSKQKAILLNKNKEKETKEIKIIKEKKDEDSQKNYTINLIGTKKNNSNNNYKKIEEEMKKLNNIETVEPKVKELDSLINKLMEITKYSREEIFSALYGTSNNIKYAYLFLKDNKKYDKYFFLKTDDYIIKNLKGKSYYQDLLNIKGEKLVKERERFLGV